MTAALVLSPAVTAHPLLGPALRYLLAKEWERATNGGGVRGISQGEHEAWLRGAADPIHLVEKMLTQEPDMYCSVVIAHDEELELAPTREIFPRIRLAAIIVDADAYSPDRILAPALEAWAQPTDQPW